MCQVVTDLILSPSGALTKELKWHRLNLTCIGGKSTVEITFRKLIRRCAGAPSVHCLSRKVCAATENRLSIGRGPDLRRTRVSQYRRQENLCDRMVTMPILPHRLPERAHVLHMSVMLISPAASSLCTRSYDLPSLTVRVPSTTPGVPRGYQVSAVALPSRCRVSTKSVPSSADAYQVCTESLP